LGLAVDILDKDAANERAVRIFTKLAIKTCLELEDVLPVIAFGKRITWLNLVMCLFNTNPDTIALGIGSCFFRSCIRLDGISTLSDHAIAIARPETITDTLLQRADTIQAKQC